MQSSVAVRLLVSAAVALVLLLIYSNNAKPDGIFSDFETSMNAVAMVKQRTRLKSDCTKETAEKLFEVPSAEMKRAPWKPTTCPFTFLDLGANVGDSLGKFIDAGIPDCSTELVARYDLDDAKLEVSLWMRHNKLTNWLGDMMHQASKQLGKTLHPEEYCYFGVEGNKLFSKQLGNLESKVMHSVPRPVRLAHFFTETVATSKNGKATLYLDSKNADHNYWGSSIYQSNPHVDRVGTSVKGKTLTTLLEQTTAVDFGNHVIIKLDIEGAEYVVVNEAYDTGILCRYAESAVRVDMIVETHKQETLDESARGAYDRFHGEVRSGLHECGVNLLAVTDARNPHYQYPH